MHKTCELILTEADHFCKSLLFQDGSFPTNRPLSGPNVHDHWVLPLYCLMLDLYKSHNIGPLMLIQISIGLHWFHQVQINKNALSVAECWIYNNNIESITHAAYIDTPHSFIHLLCYAHFNIYRFGCTFMFHCFNIRSQLHHEKRIVKVTNSSARSGYLWIFRRYS